MPSLHIWGEADDHIPGWPSAKMSTFFDGPKLHVHPGAHFVPQKGPDIAAIQEFIAPFLEQKLASAGAAPSLVPARQQKVAASADSKPSRAKSGDTATPKDDLGVALKYYVLR